MIRFGLSMLVAAVLVCAGLHIIDRAASGRDITYKIRGFHHWTVQRHWTNPMSQEVTVLLDEEAVEGTDSACDAVLCMLDKLTQIIPRSWAVRMISPTNWVPSRFNPIDRAGVEWMIRYEHYKGIEADHRWDAKYPDGSLDIDKVWTRDDVEQMGPPPAHMFEHRLQPAR